MNVIKPYFQIESVLNPSRIYSNLENIARTCYKSESKGDPEKFIKNIIDRGHEAMIEHEHITVRFIHNRGFTHELVRHRIASYAQESTRYCNYSSDKFGNELTFIEPYWLSNHKQGVVADYDPLIDRAGELWLHVMREVEFAYLKLTKFNGQGFPEQCLPPQAARGILPNDIKTEIVITANLREWRNIFRLRCAPDAHPDMRRVMIPLHAELSHILPIIFGV